MMKLRNRLWRLPAMMSLVVAFSGCTIEPPLHLASEDITVFWPEVVVDIETVWDIDADWNTGWYYGWDDRDISIFGPVEYPAPSSYQVRIYPLGENPTRGYSSMESMAVDQNRFRKRFDYGYHDLLFWSDVITYDGTHSVIFDESDISAITASTTPTSLSYRIPSRGRNDIFNNPEIFYSGLENEFYVSRNTEDYDYYDSDRKVWVKYLNTKITPMVYIYMVQVIIYNNNGRVTGVTDNAALSSMASGVTLHTGHTHNSDVNVSFPMRMKQGCETPNGQADILGGKLTTFGLCDMDSWARSRGAEYRGGRTDLNNRLYLNMLYSNAADTTLSWDVTDQLQQQSHGGIITIIIDADTLPKPVVPTGPSSGFDPVIDDYEHISSEFGF